MVDCPSYNFKCLRGDFTKAEILELVADVNEGGNHVFGDERRREAYQRNKKGATVFHNRNSEKELERVKDWTKVNRKFVYSLNLSQSCQGQRDFQILLTGITLLGLVGIKDQKNWEMPLLIAIWLIYSSLDQRKANFVVICLFSSVDYWCRTFLKGTSPFFFQ